MISPILFGFVSTQIFNLGTNNFFLQNLKKNPKNSVEPSFSDFHQLQQIVGVAG